MSYINFNCPPYPHFIVAGSASYGCENHHPNRKNVGIFDLIIIEEGILYLQENDDKHELRKHDYILLMPDTTHIGYKASSENTKFYWLHFDSYGSYRVSAFPEYLKSIDTMALSDFITFNPTTISIKRQGSLSDADGKDVLNYMKELAALNIDLKHNSIHVEDSRMSLLMQQNIFNKLMDTLDTKEKTLSLVNQVVHYIEMHFKTQFTFAKMAEALGYHPNYLTRMMRTRMNISPMQYLMHYRINYSKHLIVNTTMSIGDIALESGFKSLAYFSKVFKEKCGYLPTEYRQLMKNGIHPINEPRLT